MQSEQNMHLQEETPRRTNNLFCITPLSKYFAMALFIFLPFIGGWIGYSYGVQNVEISNNGTAFISDTRSAASNQQVESVAAGKQTHLLKFIDPNGNATLSVNGGFPVRWQVINSTSSPQLKETDTIDLYINNKSSCRFANDIPVSVEEFQWLPGEVCDIDYTQEFSVVAKLARTDVVVGESDTVSFRDDSNEVVENFSIREPFVYEKAGLRFSLPQTTKKVVRTLHSEWQGKRPESLSIYYENGAIDVSVDGYYGEWTQGVPVATVSTSTVSIGEKNYTLTIHDTYKWSEENGYSERRGKPFAVLFMDLYGDLDSDVMIMFDYTTDEIRKVSDEFLESIQFIP